MIMIWKIRKFMLHIILDEKSFILIPPFETPTCRHLFVEGTNSLSLFANGVLKCRILFKTERTPRFYVRTVRYMI